MCEVILRADSHARRRAWACESVEVHAITGHLGHSPARASVIAHLDVVLLCRQRILINPEIHTA
jgi:hypothetical protein